MSLSWRTRRRWALVLLLVGLPVYVVVAVSLVGLLERPPIWAEFLVYLGLGLLWAMPFRGLFRGVGREDPEAEPAAQVAQEGEVVDRKGISPRR